MYIAIHNLYGIKDGRKAYYRKQGDCGFDFVNDKKFASDLTADECAAIKMEEDWFCKQFNASHMTVEDEPQKIVTIHAMARNSFGSYLVTHSDTVEGVKAEIDESNARAFMKGYKMEQYLITRRTAVLWNDADGDFAKREITEEVIERYPSNMEGEDKEQ